MDNESIESPQRQSICQWVERFSGRRMKKGFSDSFIFFSGLRRLSAESMVYTLSFLPDFLSKLGITSTVFILLS